MKDPSYPIAIGDALSRWLQGRTRLERPDKAREAAVLVPLVWEDGAWRLVFTRRSDRLATHRGQVSFPGGHREPHDASSLDTALREAREEVGLRPEDVRVVGPLDDAWTLHGVRITPWLGLVPPHYPFMLDPDEVATVFRVPVTHFLDAARRRIEHRADGAGVLHPVIFYDGMPELVWGATARVVSRWLEAMAADVEGGRALLEELGNPPNALLDAGSSEA
jgi:8-oxo-dGTP pyrophosphatase MutT (NUDIX family)